MNDLKKSLPIKEKKQKLNIPESPIGIGFNVDIRPSESESNIPEINPESTTTSDFKPKSELPMDGLPVVEPAPDPKIASVTKVKVKKHVIRKRILLWVRDIAMAVLVAVLIMQFVRPTIVQQHSMEDTLHENDYIFLNRQSYNFGEVTHGDIFVFKYDPPLGSSETKKNLIKRAIGLPGDEVSINNGNVFVNNKVVDDSYTKDGYTDGYMDPMKIPEGYIFALGDNRQNSFDSRDPMVGLIDMRDVIGKAVFRVFPFDDAGPVS